MSRKGDCLDNAPMESFFSSIKTELVHRTQFRTRAEAKAALDKIAGKAAEKGVSLSDDQLKRAVLDSVRAIMLIRAFRIRGHLHADLDPLGMREIPDHGELKPETYGFTDADMDRPIFIDNVLGLQVASIRQIVDLMKRTYCGTFAIQFMHISNPEEAAWLKERIEGYGKEIAFTREGRRAILNKLVEAEGFEKFLHVKYMGTKRFGLDGGEALIPAMEQIIKRGGALGVKEVVIGMPHRGRLSVLANVLNKPYRAIFHEFQGGSYKPDDVDGSGDVKYHLGASSDRTFDDNTVHLSLTANPSHLEAVNPVVLGKVRAKQDQLSDQTHRTSVLPILLHGDAAFAGQGVVTEVLQLSQLPGYRTGGTIHVIVNNQVGFTTPPTQARSAVYSTDVAKTIQAPIFHVNGDEPESVVHVAQLAFEYRQRFNKDVVIDLVCYRRRGHNEGDDPSMTQPLMYKLIESKRSVRKLYTESLIGRKDITPEEADAALRDYQAQLERVFVETKEALKAPASPADAGSDSGDTGSDAPDNAGLERPSSQTSDATTRSADETAISETDLKHIGDVFDSPPADFTIHPKLQQAMQKRAASVSEGGIDWGTGEMIAFSCCAGAILGRASPPQMHALQNYAHDLGLAFQIADDLLDIDGDPSVTGKPARQDAAAGKATFVSILGVERARDQARLLADQAARHLDVFDGRADILKSVATYVVERRH